MVLIPRKRLRASADQVNTAVRSYCRAKNSCARTGVNITSLPDSDWLAGW
jgi:hypothetical protein